MVKNRIAIIGASMLQNPLIISAKELGFETHVFAWETGDIGEKNADFFYPISITDKISILKKCQELDIVAVVTIASDLANITVQYIAKKMGLPTNSDHTICWTTNKFEMRERLLEKGVKVPRFLKLENVQSIEKIEEWEYPLIVKPTDRSGSRGITKVYSFKELGDAVQSSLNESFEKQVIVEEFIHGVEYSVEFISFNGIHYPLAITRKFTTGSPHYIEVGHLQPGILDIDLQEKVYRYVTNVLEIMGIENGATHTEIKIDSNQNIGIIEVGSRMGGDFIGTDLVRYSTGYDYVRMVLEVSLGNKPTFSMSGNVNNSAIRFIFSPDDLNIIKKSKKNEALELVHSNIKEEDISFENDVHDSSTRKGYALFKSRNYNILINSLFQDFIS